MQAKEGPQGERAAQKAAGSVGVSTLPGKAECSVESGLDFPPRAEADGPREVGTAGLAVQACFGLKRPESQGAKDQARREEACRRAGTYTYASTEVHLHAGNNLPPFA